MADPLDKVEMTLLTGTNAVYSTANLSSTDFYGLNMEIQTMPRRQRRRRRIL